MKTAFNTNYELVNIDDISFKRKMNFYCRKCHQPIYRLFDDKGNKYFGHDDSTNCKVVLNKIKIWKDTWQKKFPKENRKIRIMNNGTEYVADICIGHCVILLRHIFFLDSNMAELNNFFINAGYNVIWIIQVADALKNSEVSITSRRHNISNGAFNYNWTWRYPINEFSFIDLRNPKNTIILESSDKYKENLNAYSFAKLDWIEKNNCKVMATVNSPASMNGVMKYIDFKKNDYIKPNARFTKSSKFNYGLNTISKTDIERISNISDINWDIFLLYLSKITEIIDYSDDWIKINIVSEKQKDFFCYQFEIFDEEKEVANGFDYLYNDIKNNHKESYEINIEIIEDIRNRFINSDV